MKIVFVVPYPIFPPDEGGRIRAYNLLKHLALEHEMLLLTPSAPANAACDLPVQIVETGPPGRRRQIISLDMLRRINAVLRQERPDVMLLEFPWAGLHAAILSRRRGIPFVMDAQNVEGDRFRTTGARVAPLVSVYERLVARAAARVWAVSDADRARFIQKGVSAAKVDVVPNGVDPMLIHPDPAARTATRAALGIDDATRMIFFFGQLDYPPNREALAIIEREISPRLARGGVRHRVIIAGKGQPTSTGDGITYLGPVPAIPPYINAADVVIAPLTSGGGTRLKILESIACGTPVVSTTIGAEGIDRAACGRLLTLADGWDAFAQAAIGVSLEDGRNVPASFLDMYSWANIVRRVRWSDVSTA